jgi:hypothetical protein
MIQMMKMSLMMSLMKQSMSTIRGWLGRPNQVDAPYRVGSLNLSRPGLQSPAASTVMPQAFLLSMPIIKHSGFRSHRHSSLLQKGSTPQQIFNPLFFLWDPDALCPDGIPCPNCRNVLHRHQAISRPRCVGIDQTFWIIGYRYRCRNCIHPR